MTRLGVAGLLAAIVMAAATGCGAPGTAPAPSAAPSSTTPPPANVAARALSAVQKDLAGRSGVRIRTTTGKRNLGASVVTADLKDGRFRAAVDLGPGNGTMEMLRISDTAWTKAPENVWTGLGYTKSSARRAEGKWVVARVDAIQQLVDGLDPVAMIQGLIRLRPADALARSIVAAGPMRGLVAVRVRSAGGNRTLYVTPGAHPRLVRIRAGSTTTTVLYDVLGYPAHVAVDVPDAADVLQQQ